MRVLVLVPDAFGGRGGIAKFNRDFLAALASHPNITTLVAIPRRIDHPPGELPPKIVYRAAGADGKLAYTLSTLGELARPHRYDWVIAGHLNLLPFAAMFTFSRRSQLGLVIHGTDAWQPSRRLLTAAGLRRLCWLLSVSDHTLARFLRWAPVTAIAQRLVVPNTVDTNSFAPGDRRRDLVDRYGLEGRTVIMTLARLDARERCKGVDQTLDALPQLLHGRPSLAYMVCGDGTDRPRLEAKALSMGLGDRVVFTGYVSEADKADHYRLADCFLLAGWCEGFGIALLEAQACGIPVVASVLDGSREAIVNRDRAILVDPRDPADLRAGIETALARGKGVPIGIERFGYAPFERAIHSSLG